MRGEFLILAEEDLLICHAGCPVEEGSHRGWAACVAPAGAFLSWPGGLPTAAAVGYDLPPLRGFRKWVAECYVAARQIVQAGL